MITSNQKIILKLLSNALSQSNRKLDAVSDWNAILDEASKQCVFLIVYENAQDYIKRYLKADELKKWNTRKIQLIRSSIKNAYQHNKLHNLLADNAVPYVILKGQASAFYYPNPLLRTTGDVDFLVEKGSIEKVKELLLEESYSMNPHNTSLCHLDFHKRNELLEMHWEPNGIPNGEKGDLCRTYLQDAVSAAKLFEKDGLRLYLPDRLHHGFILLLHTAHHMINTGIGLRHLCDWAVFVNSVSDEEFITLFKDKLKSVGLWRFAQTLTQLCVHYLDCEYKKWADEDVDEEYLEKLLCDIFESGNLGIKDPGRINEAKLMTTYSEGNITSDNMVKHLFKMLSDKSKQELPICKRFRILMPFGCLYISYRHLRRAIQGKRPKIHISKMVNGANKRGQIYRQLKLFE